MLWTPTSSANLYLTSERAEQTEQAFLKDPQWAAPLLWRSELRNVLALYIRRDVLELEEAQQIMDEATRLMLGQEYDIVSTRVLSLTAASTCSVYDCEFVTLAQDLNVPLVTVDRQILAQFPGIAVALEDYVAA